MFTVNSIIHFVLNKQDQQVWESFVDLAGRAAQRLGLARSLGQVYAALYLSPRPLGLEDLMEQLQISKGNASMSVRQLADWGAVERIWVKGDRRDFWQANDDFREVARRFFNVMLRPRIESTREQLAAMDSALSGRRGGPDGGDAEFMRRRIAKLQSFQSKAGKLIPMVEKLL